MDVKIVKVRISESITERAIYIAVGVDLGGNKFVLDYEVRDREDLDGWKSFLGGLVSSGVRVDVIVSHDFSGLDRVVSTLFPSSQHQLCITHLVSLMRVLPDKEKELIRVRDLKSSRNVGEGRLYCPSANLSNPFLQPEPRGFLTLLTSTVPFSTSPGRLDTTSTLITRRRVSTRPRLGSRRSSEVTFPLFAPWRSISTFRSMSNSRWKFRPMSVIRHHSYHLKQLHASRFQVSLDGDF